jgi:hypothetical protein
MLTYRILMSNKNKELAICDGEVELVYCRSCGAWVDA